MITRENVRSHELIGMTATVEGSSNRQVVGLNGRIVDETKSMLTIDTADGTRMIPKRNTRWILRTRGAEFAVDGDSLAKRPQDRVGRGR